MTVAELRNSIAVAGLRHEESAAHASLTREITDIAYDSRVVSPGAAFVALKGLKSDGVAFAQQAIARGAVAVIAEVPPQGNVTIPWFVVADGRRALSAASATFFGHPSSQLTAIGITGTNGKTTTSFLVQSVFESAGIRCGRIGTIGYFTGSEERDAARTTPEAPDVQRMLREMVDEECGACAMEVSSHALALGRAADVRFAAAVFTNLTRDHLDYHGDMEAYFRAKRRLFELLPETGVGVINADDPRGADLARAIRRPVTYAIRQHADVRPGPVSFTLDGLTCDVHTPRGLLQITSPLLGRPNLYNILAATATGVALDLSFSALEHGIAALKHVPGRFQVVSERADDVAVVVDYAHTDDALKNLLETARPLARGRVITVFGCGGDRDKTKRPLMGAVAARLSDLVVVTSDNPRSEDPEAIIEDIKRGIVQPPRPGAPKNGSPRSTPYLAIVDRAAAIERAIRDAAPGDLVLLAGKGHETYQEIGDRKIAFDDVEVARAVLARRRAGLRVP